MTDPQTRSRARRWVRYFAWFFGSILLLGVGLCALVHFDPGSCDQKFYDYIVAVSSRRHGAELPPVDEVEILALGGDATEGQQDSFRTFGGYAGTVNRHTVSGAEAESIAALWRSIPVGPQYEAMCYSPFYALRFRSHGKLILETAVCWHCSTYTLPAGILGTVSNGFDARSEPARKLLATLTQYAPHPGKVK
jgi:hypothetical protein